MDRPDEQELAHKREQDIDRGFTGKDPDQAFRRDYKDRNRKHEWRSRWFLEHRSQSDRELYRDALNALTVKKNIIEWQRQTADHMAGYGPPGAGTPWVSIGPRNINGRVKSIAVHPTNPNIVYAGSASGGVWKTTDGGQSWRPLWDAQESLAIGSIAIAPSAPETIYVGTGEWTPGYGANYPGAGVYVSTDGGTNWTRRAAVVARRISRILVSPTNANRVFVAGANGFERSIDGGVMWETVWPGQISDAVIDPNNPDILYINVSNDRIYKSINGGDDWDPLDNGPTGASAAWIKLAIGDNGASGSNLILARSNGTIYRSTDGGTMWTTLAGSHATGWVGWCDMIAVAPDDDNLIMVGGVGMERTTNGGGMWTSPGGLHADQHVAIFAPSNTNIVYECNDGGVYRSDDKGATWKKVSHGMVVTQFYDCGSWNRISTVVGGGTQDNGTNLSSGGLTWKHIMGNDGGYLLIHPTDPRTMYAESQYTALAKTTNGGGSWTPITGGLTGGTPWVGVMTMDQNNPNTLYVGTTRVFKTTDGCATDWVQVSQVLAGNVSTIAIAPSNSNRVYVGAGNNVYRSDDAGMTNPWANKTEAPLPARPVTDIMVDFMNADRLVVTFGGTNGMGTSNHVFISTNGGDDWTDISSNLPNISVNAVVLDPNTANTIYVGTDVGVFRTIDLGMSWQAFDNGIPNVVIVDLHIDREDNMLYAATFGRGMYRLDITPGASEPSVDLYLRDSVLDVGERFPSPGGEPNPTDTGDTVHWWESADIKVQSLPYYSPDALFDGVEFDEDLVHEDAVRNQANRFYLQVHNRGWANATNVRVRAFFANASAGLPPLPNALTAPDFNLSSTVNWQPIGAAQTIPLLEPNRPVIVSWDWNVPMAAATHSCLMAVVSSAEDPITTTETNVDLLIKSEKRVCLKNLHVINSAGPAPQQSMVTIDFNNARPFDDLIDIVIDPIKFSNGTIGVLLEKVEFEDAEKALVGVELYPLRDDEQIGSWYDRSGQNGKDLDALLNDMDRSRIYEFDASKVSELRGIRMKAGEKLRAVITCRGSRKVPYGETQKFTVMQRQGGDIVGGSTYEVRLTRAKDLHPVSHIRVILEKVQILDDNEPWWKGKGEFRFETSVGFNEESCREHTRRLPRSGHYSISDSPGHNEQEIGLCIFDGYVAEKDNMTLTIRPVEEDCPDADDALPLYSRTFSGPPETWVGQFGGGEDGAEGSWRVWYRIESVDL